jgi:hypothetical protein
VAVAFWGCTGIMGVCNESACVYNPSSDDDGDEEKSDSVEESKGLVDQRAAGSVTENIPLGCSVRSLMSFSSGKVGKLTWTVPPNHFIRAGRWYWMPMHKGRSPKRRALTVNRTLGQNRRSQFVVHLFARFGGKNTFQ